MKPPLIFMFAVAALFGAGEARAAPAAGPFQVQAIGDAELDGIRGGAPLQPLTAYAVRRMADDQSRYDFTGTAQAARVVVDNWNNDVGAQLILNSAVEQALGR